MIPPYQKGMAAEHLCISHLILKGHSPCVPATGGDPYDLILPKGDKCLKIQVKSTSTTSYSSYTPVICKGSKNKTTYTPEEVDIFSIYISPEDIWYHIPHEATNGIKKLYINPNDQNGKYHQYKNNWDIFA